MAGFQQLDLFANQPELDGSLGRASETRVAPENLSDDDLISAIPDATLAAASVTAAEAARRKLSAAVPALSSLCNRFVGYGADAVVPEQVAALRALGDIGGPEAANVVSKSIVKSIVQGPTLSTALDVASELGVQLPHDASLSLLRDKNPSVRAAACACVRAGHEVSTMLLSMMNDPDGEVALASACALGRMGRSEALGHLKRYLLERPSRRVVESLARIADEEAVVFLARTGRKRRDLTDIIIVALEEIEGARALNAAAALRRLSGQAE